MKHSEVKIGFDWVWNVLPSISLYHVVIVTIVGYVGTIGGYTAVVPVFVQYKQTARCSVKADTEAFYSGMELTFDDINNLTKVEQVPFDECAYYDLNYDACDENSSYRENFLECMYNLKDASIANNTQIIGNCVADDIPSEENIIFDTSQFTSTVPSEFNLACNRAYLNSLATSLSFIGLFFGAMMAGYFSDNYGRKITIVVAITLNAFFWVLQGWLPSYAAFVVVRILVQGSNQAAYLTYNCYACEIVGPKGRAYTGMIPNFTFAFGYMMMSLFSYFIPDWRELTFLLAGLTFPFILTWWFWPESPRWLYGQGRYVEAEAIISDMVTRCDVDLSEFAPDVVSDKDAKRVFLDTLKSKCTTDKNGSSTADEEIKRFSVFDLFTSGKFLAMTSVTICFSFICVVMAYYGLSYGAGDLPGDIFVNNVINGAVEVAAYVASFFLLNVLGRRMLTAGPLLFSGVCMIGGMLLVQFVGGAWTHETFRWLMFAGKFGVSGTFAVIWIYSAELFPTEVRTNALAMGSMAGRIGGIISPFINNFHTSIPWLPATIFGSACLLGGMALLTLPETLGRPLMNTVEEANNYYGRRASTVASKLGSPDASARSLNKS